MNLSEYLKENKLNVKEFAEILDYTREHISHVINGKSKPSAKLKRQISKATKGQVTFD